MPKDEPRPGRQRMRRAAFARWEDEGGAVDCGPQVPGVAKDCAQETATSGGTASQSIDAIIAALGDWRGETLRRARALIREADPEVVETVKWRKPSNPAGVPVWERSGIICTGQAFKGKVKLTFARGAKLEDPTGLFNASLEGNAMRAIDIHEGETVDGEALKALVRAAVALNLEG